MAAFGRGPQPARPGPAWRPGTRPPVTRKPFGRPQDCRRGRTRTRQRDPLLQALTQTYEHLDDTKKVLSTWLEPR